ncbi:DNA methyltransferase [Nostoc sp. UHCC 0252]|uniref:DNA methyltransferase n=1 Tax=Nostoc sp. UHCC 0252 TaxID=3110241 RepID=UPI002B1FECB0|nr:DNA methyltransferase [Nostoc sp. UHCC 0252]MEA5601971.1 DNA methyltransferase [Nostoc sp. UHCC 0252]
MSTANQLSLDLDSNNESDSISERVKYSPIHVSESTFLAGLSVHIHRWFRLTPSFAPDLVREMLHELNAEIGDYILDPFSGAGTTAIESALEGFDSLGFEINPFLYFVNRTSLNWSLDTESLQLHLSRILNDFYDSREKASFETLEEFGYKIPPIHNPTRWWRPDILKDLLALKQCIYKIKNQNECDFFRLALAGVLVPDLTNVTLGRLQLHFINRDNDEIDVAEIFTKHTQQMIKDLCSVQKLPRLGSSKVFLQNSTNLSNVNLHKKVDCVITSPPYPNRYSYVWNTRPHLYMLDFISAAKEASSIDKETIGGTWGTATSELSKGVFPPLNKAVEEAVGSTISAIREQDNLMANYAVHYFNRLTAHLIELERISSPNLRIAYVVGNSWLKGVYIETDVILAEILDRLKLGYTINSVHRFRKRNSGKELFESIVYASKS